MEIIIILALLIGLIIWWRVEENNKALDPETDPWIAKKITVIHLSTQWRWLPVRAWSPGGILLYSAWLCWQWYKQEIRRRNP